VRVVIAWLKRLVENYASTPPRFLATGPVGVAVGMAAQAVLDQRLRRVRSG